MCPVCGGDLNDAFDVHEVFLTKGDVQGCKINVQVDINSLMNCVGIHPACHVKAQHEQKFKDKCARLILEKETPEKVINWLAVIRTGMKGDAAFEAIRWIKTLV